MTSLESSQQGLVFDLPPSPAVREFAATLDSCAPRLVLDAGCGQGRNALYLAKAGHDVVGVSNELADLRSAQTLLARSSNITGRCRFVAGDVRALPVRTHGFDIVLSNEVLHFMAKTDSRRALNSLRDRTRQGGVNLISGYVVRPNTANAINTAHCFAPDELRQSYESAGWHVLEYNEQYHNNQYVGPGRREIISSLATIIAQRPWR